MTDFIPGDSYRLDIVGADSSIIIDSWLSQVKASVVNKDGQLQVDTTFGKLKDRFSQPFPALKLYHLSTSLH